VERPPDGVVSLGAAVPRTYNVLETIFVCEGGSVRLLDFMPIFPEAAGGTVHPPNAVIRIIEGLDGEIEIESLCQPGPDAAVSLADVGQKGEVRSEHAEAAGAAGAGVARKPNEEKRG
jgi:hypothetical protein